MKVAMVKDEKITTHPNEGMKSNKYNKKKREAKKTTTQTLRILLFLHSCNLIIHELTAK